MSDQIRGVRTLRPRIGLWLVLWALAAQPLAAFAQDAEGEEDGDFVRFGGALRFNYVYADWLVASRARGGDLAFDIFRIDVEGSLDDWIFAAEYRFYTGFQALRYGWVGRRLSDELEARLGVTQAPFGLLPFASHNWFFNLPYYVGLEDDYDLGLALKWEPGPVRVDLAFFKNSEGSFIGDSTDSARYSYDVITEQPSGLVELDTANAEANQFNGRLAWRLGVDDLSAELGVSGMIGLLGDRVEERFGHRWAMAAHADMWWGPWNLRGEVVSYAFFPVRNPAHVIPMGAYDAPYLVADRGIIYVGGIAYRLQVDYGPVDTITFYENFSLLDKRVEGFDDSVQNVVGALLVTGPIATYFDLATGRNHPFIGPNYNTALAQGGGGWNTRFNVNIGLYF